MPVPAPEGFRLLVTPGDIEIGLADDVLRDADAGIDRESCGYTR